MTVVRLVTWLAPGIPLDLFARIRTVLEWKLEMNVVLASRTKRSGPRAGSLEPFATGDAEVGFLCAPAAIPEQVRLTGGFELSGLAPVFDDERYAGLPICFCDIVVHANHPAHDLDDLRGSRFGFNDASSLSGWLGLNSALVGRGSGVSDFFSSVVQTGGHLQSLEQLRTGRIEVASIDSNVLQTHAKALDGLRAVHSIGPWPSQPVVFRKSLSSQTKSRLYDALLSCGPWPAFNFIGFREQEPSLLMGVPSAVQVDPLGH